MPFYTAKLEHPGGTLYYAHKYHGAYVHADDDTFRAAALAVAANVAGIAQNQFRATYRNIEKLQPHLNYAMI